MSELALRLPEYDQPLFEKRYAELGQYVVSVPADMMKLGYEGINELYARIQALINRVDEIKTEADRLLAESSAVLEACKYAYEAKRDAKIAALEKGEYESIKILEAKVNVELAEDLQLMRRAKVVTGLFKAYRTTVLGKLKNLESAKKTLELQNNNLKRQTPPPMPYGSIVPPV